MSGQEFFFVFLVAFLANSLPAVVFETFKLSLVLQIPIDLNIFWRGRRLLGDHKTVIGTLLIIVGANAVWLATWGFFAISERESTLFVGLRGAIEPTLIGLGVLGGDFAGSFIKRRLNIVEGKDLLIVDNIDWIVGVMIVSFFLYELPQFYIIALITAFFFVLHVAVDRLARMFNLRH